MRYHKQQPKVNRICEQCKAPFTIFASLLRYGKAGRWCSRHCWLLASRVTVTCDKCGNSFERLKSFVSRYSGKNYCSRECTNLARRRPGRIAIKQLRYGSGAFQQARKKVIERDGFCQICDSALANSVHHKNWNPYDHHLDNLVLLCKSCHGRFKRFEDFDAAKGRIMACSDLHGDMQSAVETSAPVLAYA